LIKKNKKITDQVSESQASMNRELIFLRLRTCRSTIRAQRKTDFLYIQIT